MIAPVSKIQNNEAPQTKYKYKLRYFVLFLYTNYYHTLLPKWNQRWATQSHSFFLHDNASLRLPFKSMNRTSWCLYVGRRTLSHVYYIDYTYIHLSDLALHPHYTNTLSRIYISTIWINVSSMCIKFLAPKTTNNKPTKQKISDSDTLEIHSYCTYSKLHNITV